MLEDTLSVLCPLTDKFCSIQRDYPRHCDKVPVPSTIKGELEGEGNNMADCNKRQTKPHIVGDATIFSITHPPNLNNLTYMSTACNELSCKGAKCKSENWLWLFCWGVDEGTNLVGHSNCCCAEELL